ncbi:MAG: Smr/MutS family protein, partial [Acidobacteriota bacterium]
FDADFEPPVVEMEVTDVLDLHTFAPRDIKALVRDYLDLAVEKGFPQVRVIHGKGKGVQRQTVRSILEKDPRVEAFGDPPGEAGGWGATWVRFKASTEPSP